MTCILNLFYICPFGTFVGTLMFIHIVFYVVVVEMANWNRAIAELNYAFFTIYAKATW